MPVSSSKNEQTEVDGSISEVAAAADYTAWNLKW